MTEKSRYQKEKENALRFLNLTTYKLGKELEKIIAGHDIDEPFEIRHVLITLAFSEAYRLYLDLLRDSN